MTPGFEASSSTVSFLMMLAKHQTNCKYKFHLLAFVVEFMVKLNPANPLFKYEGFSWERWRHLELLWLSGWSHWPLLAPSVGISGYKSVESGGLASNSQHYAQQFHGWNWTEILVWSGHERRFVLCQNSHVNPRQVYRAWVRGKEYSIVLENSWYCNIG